MIWRERESGVFRLQPRDVPGQSGCRFPPKYSYFSFKSIMEKNGFIFCIMYMIEGFYFS